MRRAIVSAIGAASLLLLASCSGGGGTTSRTIEAGGFTAVETGDGIDVDVATSADPAVVLTADRLAVGRIVVEVRDATLRIGLRPGTLARARWLAGQARVTVALPVLERLAVSGGSQARLAVSQPDRDLAVTLSGGSSLGGSLACAAFTLEASGGGGADLGGSAASVRLSGSGGVKLRLSAFETPVMRASLSGGSTAAVAVSERLEVEAGGGSGLSFRGDARVERQELSGGSWVRRE